ncbi:MAG: hypothetical protein H8E44_26575 [Planctomycetes bacterium]|nr:hypothetical protein [Planctomycetota bacterium]MBL7044803.1 hypothetical protein [Pirellulaceae bacterium]
MAMRDLFKDMVDIVTVLAALIVLVGVAWSIVGVFMGTWEESNGLYPLQQWMHDGSPVTRAAINGLVFLFVFLALAILALVKGLQSLSLRMTKRKQIVLIVVAVLLVSVSVIVRLSPWK